MSDEGMNPAEAAAEEILKQAADEAQAESCPQGRECAVHFRNTEEYIEESIEYARFITYVGEYVVITDDNPEAVDVVATLKAVLGIGTAPKPGDRWETSIYHVGGGTVSDLADKTIEERKQAFRYHSTHDVWDQVPAEHRAAVSSLEAGLIDVSKPWGE